MYSRDGLFMCSLECYFGVFVAQLRKPTPKSPERINTSPTEYIHFLYTCWVYLQAITQAAATYCQLGRYEKIVIRIKVQTFFARKYVWRSRVQNVRPILVRTQCIQHSMILVLFSTWNKNARVIVTMKSFGTALILMRRRLLEYI